MRADHLGCYGHERDTSPHLDAFAAEGVLFERAQATSPWTLPSHVSLLTGLDVDRHGVVTLDDRLAAQVPTLARVLSEAGLDTAGFVNSIFLGEGFGLHAGFGTYRVLPHEDAPEGVARKVNDEALAWLSTRRERRVFLFLHYYDAHSDYHSLPRYEQLFVDGAGRVDGSTGQLLAIQAGRLEVGPEEIERLKRLYDAGIRQLDDELGRLFGWLREHGWLEDSLVIVTADHGEEFLEHGGVLHTGHHGEVLRIPLLLRGPGLPAGARVAAPVSLVDVVPTALSLLGVASAQPVDGIDLRPLWKRSGEASAERLLFARGATMRKDTRRSVRSGSHKLIVDLEAGTRALYDLAEDPGETRDLSVTRPDVAERLAESLERRGEARSAPASAAPIGEDLEAKLRSLGYVD